MIARATMETICVLAQLLKHLPNLSNVNQVHVPIVVEYFKWESHIPYCKRLNYLCTYV